MTSIKEGLEIEHAVSEISSAWHIVYKGSDVLIRLFSY